MVETIFLPETTTLPDNTMPTGASAVDIEFKLIWSYISLVCALCGQWPPYTRATWSIQSIHITKDLPVHTTLSIFAICYCFHCIRVTLFNVPPTWVYCSCKFYRIFIEDDVLCTIKQFWNKEICLQLSVTSLRYLFSIVKNADLSNTQSIK